MQNIKTYWRYLIVAALIIFILWIVHQLALRWVINKTTEHVAEKWNVSVTIGSYQTRGVTGALFKNIVVNYGHEDTLLWVDSLELKMRFLPLLVGKIYLSKFTVHHAAIRLNTRYLKTSKTVSSVTEHAGRKSHGTVFGFANKFFKLLPNACSIDSLTIVYSDSAGWVAVNAGNFKYQNKLLKGRINISDEFGQTSFMVEGEILPRRRQLSCLVQQFGSADSGISYLQQKWGIILSFHTARFEYHGLNSTTSMLNISVSDLNIFHRQLADQTIQFDTTNLSLVFTAGKDYWQVDSLSQIGFNGFYFPIFLRYEKDTASPLLTFAIPKINFSAQQFFDALPKGAFRRMVGVKALGSLSFSLRGQIPFGEVDSLYLNSQLEPNNFRITHYGLANLPMLNDTFTLYRHDPGMLPVTIRVDTMAKTYTHLRDISRYLIYAVLTSEDGSFFYHKGFNDEAFARSLAENIRKKRFARGASTITMQLVRNVFLSKNKTLARKFEEILLTWMLENSHIVSKERMLEIYLNIIEWGPNIYGIQQAAKFYFNKKPSQLTLQESIFLAAIIPSPKYFRYTFVTNGKMKDGFQGYFHRVAQIMLARNQILPVDTVGLCHRVLLTGDAQKFLVTSLDTLVAPADTTFFDPAEDF